MALQTQTTHIGANHIKKNADISQQDELLWYIDISNFTYMYNYNYHFTASIIHNIKLQEKKDH